MSNKIFKWIIVSLIILMVVGIGYAYILKTRYDNQVSDLQNLLAEKTNTIEVQKNVYDKLVLKSKDLESLLNSKDAEIQKLNNLIKSKDQEILTLTNLVITWKKAYEDEANAHQSEEGNRIRVDFTKDFGIMKVDGYTLTNPAYAWIKIQQGTLLKLTLAITQDKDKLWHSYVTSSDDNFQIDVAVSAVNPYILEQKWYEKIIVNGMLSLGQNNSTIGGLVGIGASVEINQFTIGPMLIVGISDKIDKYLGVNASWRPFMR